MLADQEKSTNYLLSDEYNFREIDNFSSIIDMNEYSKIIDIKKLMMYTTVSYIFAIIVGKINNLELTNSLNSKSTLPEVVLNIYPYEMEQRLMEILQNAIFTKLKKKCFVTIASVPPAEITPFYLNSSEVSFLFIYNYNSWLNHNSDLLDKVKIPNTIVYFPSLYKELPTKQDNITLEKTGFKDYFSYMEFLYSQRAMVRFLPTIMYSNELVASAKLDKMNKALVKEAIKNQETAPNTEVKFGKN
jgi:hypothetical protein